MRRTDDPIVAERIIESGNARRAYRELSGYEQMRIGELAVGELAYRDCKVPELNFDFDVELTKIFEKLAKQATRTVPTI